MRDMRVRKRPLSIRGLLFPDFPITYMTDFKSLPALPALPAKRQIRARQPEDVHYPQDYPHYPHYPHRREYAAVTEDEKQRLAASAEARIAEQVQAARERADRQAATRNLFAERRRAGVNRRNAARAARLRLTAQHQQKGQEQ